MTVISERKYQSFGRPWIVAVLLVLLAGCGSSVPLTETRPASGTAAAAGAGPLWARQLISGAFKCNEGQVDIKMGEGQHNIVLKWQGSNYVMLPVTTSTGALRFEGSGLVWLQIPAKSMLLNAKIGQQLANECKV